MPPLATVTLEKVEQPGEWEAARRLFTVRVTASDKVQRRLNTVRVTYNRRRLQHMSDMKSRASAQQWDTGDYLRKPNYLTGGSVGIERASRVRRCSAAAPVTVVRAARWPIATPRSPTSKPRPPSAARTRFKLPPAPPHSTLQTTTLQRCSNYNRNSNASSSNISCRLSQRDRAAPLRSATHSPRSTPAAMLQLKALGLFKPAAANGSKADAAAIPVDYGAALDWSAPHRARLLPARVRQSVALSCFDRLRRNAGGFLAKRSLAKAPAKQFNLSDLSDRSSRHEPLLRAAIARSVGRGSREQQQQQCQHAAAVAAATLALWPPRGAALGPSVGAAPLLYPSQSDDTAAGRSRALAAAGSLPRRGVARGRRRCRHRGDLATARIA